ncbi:MAG: hypothetical protein ACKOFX_03850, partial [Solirubrobacterales bacterium]
SSRSASSLASKIALAPPAMICPLSFSHSGYGIGEAIVGLAAQVREQLAFTPRGQEPPGYGPLFLKLRVAEREGRLEELLDGSAVLRNPRLERLAAAERLPDLAA